ncbi:1747_t:CDS:2, partial [Gigaspora rosea]
MTSAQSTIDSLKELNSRLVSEIDKLRKKFAEVEAENIELKAENVKVKAENTEIKADNSPINSSSIPEQIVLQSEDAPASDISDNASNSDVCQEPLTRCPASPIHTEPKLLEDKKINNFLDMQNKKEVSDMMIKRNREKKLQRSLNNSIPSILSEVSTMPTSPVSNIDMSESLDSKTVKKLLNQNQDKNLDKSHKKKGTEDIVQVIANGIRDNILLDESEVRSLASSNNVTEIAYQICSITPLLDLAQLFDKATDAEHYAMKANQEETLCWISYGKEF